MYVAHLRSFLLVVLCACPICFACEWQCATALMGTPQGPPYCTVLACSCLTRARVDLAWAHLGPILGLAYHSRRTLPRRVLQPVSLPAAYLTGGRPYLSRCSSPSRFSAPCMFKPRPVPGTPWLGTAGQPEHICQLAEAKGRPELDLALAGRGGGRIGRSLWEASKPNIYST